MSLVPLAQQAPCIGPTKHQIAISQGAMPITSLSASCEEYRPVPPQCMALDIVHCEQH